MLRRGLKESFYAHCFVLELLSSALFKNGIENHRITYAMFPIASFTKVRGERPEHVESALLKVENLTGRGTAIDSGSFSNAMTCMRCRVTCSSKYGLIPKLLMFASPSIRRKFPATISAVQSPNPILPQVPQSHLFCSCFFEVGD